MMPGITEIFTAIGGQFLCAEEVFTQKLSNIRAFVFDWDGVFTDGGKDQDMQSRFNEVDSMGTNMLRFSYYLQQKALPIMAIISGENNAAAFKFVDRERFHLSYCKTANKLDAAAHLCDAYGLQLHQLAFVFDDVLDLSLAEACGLRICITRQNNPLFNRYIVKHRLADYITSAPSGQFVVREACELMMGAYGNFDDTIRQRSQFSEQYNAYLELRRNTNPQYFIWNKGAIEKISQTI